MADATFVTFWGSMPSKPLAATSSLTPSTSASFRSFAENFVELNPLPGQGPGRAGLADVLGMMFAGFPDLRWTLHDTLVEGDRVMGFSTWTGTHEGEFMGIPATGRTATIEAWTIDRFRDGIFVESRIIMDVAGLLGQLGVLPAPEAA